MTFYTQSIFQLSSNIADAVRAIDEECKRIGEEEGLKPVERTGKVLYFDDTCTTWFEVKDEYNTTSWLSLDFPMNVAHGEICVCALDEDHARTFGQDN